MERVLEGLARARGGGVKKGRSGKRGKIVPRAPADDDARVIAAELRGTVFTDVVNNYTIEIGDRIGSGSYGVVLSGVMDLVGRALQVAVKVPMSTACDDVADECEVLEEIGLGGIDTDYEYMCRHMKTDHVPLIAYLGQFQGVVRGHMTTMMVTRQYACSLESMAPEKRRALDMCRIGRDIVGALDYVHRRLHASGTRPTLYYVHRDVSTSNILMDSAGRAYLGDFGSVMRYCDEPATACPGDGYVYVRGRQTWMEKSALEAGDYDARYQHSSRRTDIVSALLCVMRVMLETTKVWLLAADNFLYTKDGVESSAVDAYLRKVLPIARDRSMITDSPVFPIVVGVLALTCSDVVDCDNVRCHLRV